ncbi:MAG: GTP-binding protein [Candidatus Micrarchaeota archaeon]
MAKEIRISLLGHKDHGKSTLVGRLLHDTGSMTKDRIEEAKAICAASGKEFELAFLLDSFVEEREGGFTLDTTTAQARHRDVIYNLIDVPGHRELVKNMLSGASQADAAILIVSAKEDEGLQDETRLHLYMASMLGIRRLVVAVNKMDAVGYGRERFESLKSSVSAVLSSFGFGDFSFVPVSARNGDNVMERSGSMEWYDGRPLISLMEEFADGHEETRLRSLAPRLFVQDAYDVDGGKMLVGRLETGMLGTGQVVAIEPLGLRTTIKAIHSPGGAERKEAEAGQNIGLRLAYSGDIGRGCVIAGEESAPRAGREFEALIFCFPECSLEPGEELTVTCSSQEASAMIKRVRSRMNPIKDLHPHPAQLGGVGSCEAAEVSLETGSPLVFERFSEMPPTGRFIISKAGKIAGVGVIL